MRLILSAGLLCLLLGSMLARAQEPQPSIRFAQQGHVHFEKASLQSTTSFAHLLQSLKKTATQLSLQFRTDHGDGLIFHNNGLGGSLGSDFLTLELNAGVLVFHMSAGGAPTVLRLGSWSIPMSSRSR